MSDPSPGGAPLPPISPASVRHSGRRHGRRDGDAQGRGGSPLWMVTFTDIMGLMLTFFVMLYAMASPRQEEWDSLTNTIQSNFNKYYGLAETRGFQESISIDKIDFSRALDLHYLRALMTALLKQEGRLSSVALINQESSLILSLPQDLLFNPSDAVVKPEGAKALYAVADILSRIRNRVEIVGHTDPRPIATKKFPTNWDLSMARAAAVAAVLQDAGYTQPVMIRGQAAGRYADLPARMAEDQKLAVSRRVDIVIMEDDGKRVKLFEIAPP